MIELRRLRRPASALVVVSTLLLAGCGDKQEDATPSSTTSGEFTPPTTEPGPTSSTTAPTTTEVPKTLEAAIAARAESTSLDKDGMSCLGQKLATAVGEPRAITLLNATEPPNDEELKVFTEAGNTCFTSAQLASSVSQSLGGEVGLDEDSRKSVESCFAKEWEGKTGEVLASTSRSGEEALANEMFRTSMDSCIDVGVIAKLLTSSRGAKEEQVKCLTDRLDGQIKFSQVFSGDQAAGTTIDKAMSDCGLAAPSGQG